MIEKREERDEDDVLQVFASCPFGAAPYNEEYEGLSGCIGAESGYKEVWRSKAQKEENERYNRGYVSHFTTGKVTVNLKYPILLSGGLELNEYPNEEEGHEFGETQWIGATGGSTIEAVAQPAIALTKGVDTALLSESELARYNYYVHDAKQTKTTATVELAGPATGIKESTERLLEEVGVAFGFPVKVKLSNPFLGEDCYVGSDEDPIYVPFTTGESGELSGKRGSIYTEDQGQVIAVWGDTLVSSEFSAPGVENCGVEGGADAALDAGLGLPSASGNTAVLNGVLRAADAEVAEEGLFG